MGNLSSCTIALIPRNACLICANSYTTQIRDSQYYFAMIALNILRSSHRNRIIHKYPYGLGKADKVLSPFCMTKEYYYYFNSSLELPKKNLQPLWNNSVAWRDRVLTLLFCLPSLESMRNVALSIKMWSRRINAFTAVLAPSPEVRFRWRKS